jgi:hypothetical protein
VYFETGWMPRPDGVWALSSRIPRQVRRGHRLGFRRIPPGLEDQVVAGQRVGTLPEMLPIEAVCSNAGCGQRQTLDCIALRALVGAQEGHAHSVDLPRQGRGQRLVYLYDVEN